jgi:hypothetical protein
VRDYSCPTAQVVPLVVLVYFLREMCPRRIDGWRGRVTESHVEAPLSNMSLFFCEDTGMLLVVRLLLSENRLGREVKKLCHIIGAKQHIL